MDAERTSFHVGVNVFAVRDGRLLLGKRKNIYGAGTWGLPGGHLEPREGMQEAAARELREETGLIAERFEFAALVNDRHSDKNYLQVGFATSGLSDGKPVLREPDLCEEWKWFPLDELPKEIFAAHRELIRLFREHSQFADA